VRDIVWESRGTSTNRNTKADAQCIGRRVVNAGVCTDDPRARISKPRGRGSKRVRIGGRLS